MNKIAILNRNDGKDIPTPKTTSFVRFIPAKCYKTKEGLFVKLIRDDKGWCWDSTLKDGAGQGSSSDRYVENIVFDAPQRTSNGFCCAGCGGKTVVQCNSCRQFTCWSGTGLWTCAFCGNTGNPSGTIKSVGAIPERKK